MKGSSGSGKKQTGLSPCAACKLLRRMCDEQCVFAPYFPAHHPHKFINVHKVYGASNVNKMLQELPVHQRGDAVSSMVYEANARVRDPVYGCVGAISSLQHQLDGLRAKLALAQAEVAHLRMLPSPTTCAASVSPPSPNIFMDSDSQPQSIFDMDMWILDSDDVTYPAATIHMKAGSIAISTVLIMDDVSQ
ncbi:LOB domain-containing protein 4-like [Senna tora]|uniref:LOB domain-containing protein 4-like n=1 Tax=Senna tora TaxID=362788 RepID=A0A834X4T8_9FABA|nr:LOB domain-containing protein 4-like [Senna tora]